MSNPLAPVLAWYRTAIDSLLVTHRVITTGVKGAVTRKHVFHGRTPADNKTALDQVRGELNRLVVLGLVAVFERTLRDHLAALPVIAPTSGHPLHDAVRTEVLKDVEFWNISSRVIDLFKAVDPALRGQVKQIIDYRNWVAHGQTQSQPAPIVILPPAVHQRLTDFLSQAKVI